MKIILGPASVELANRISQLTGLPCVNVASRVFPDGESYVRLEGDVKDEHAVIVQTTCAPQNSRLMELAFMAAAAKRYNAKKVTAVVPYLGYARQDKIFLQGENISIETVATMLKASGIDQLITVNVHEANALKLFPIPARSISAIPLIADYFVKKGIKEGLRPLTGQRRNVHRPTSSTGPKRRNRISRKTSRPIHRTDHPNSSPS